MATVTTGRGFPHDTRGSTTGQRCTGAQRTRGRDHRLVGNLVVGLHGRGIGATSIDELFEEEKVFVFLLLERLEFLDQFRFLRLLFLQ